MSTVAPAWDTETVRPRPARSLPSLAPVASLDGHRQRRAVASTSIVLADGETLLRGALARLLPLEREIEVVAEVGDGAQAVRVTLSERPDVLVIDLDLPGSDGLDVVAAIRQSRPEQAVLMLTHHATAGVLRRALKLGVQGFVSKSAELEQIALAIGLVGKGERWIDPEVSARAIMDDCPLTDRELDALRLTSEGYSVADIATRLFLAEGTVRNYLSNAMAKTQARSRHEAARFARAKEWL